MARRPVGAVVGALVLAAVAGCGGGDGGTKAPTDPTQAFKDQVIAICTKSHADLVTVGSVITDPKHPKPAELTAAAAKLAEYFTVELKNLRAVVPPASQKQAFEQLLTSLQHVVTSVKKKGASFIDPDTTVFEPLNANATALGVDACSV